MRIFQIVLEVIWFLLALVCVYMGFRVMPTLPSRSWIFFTMALFSLFMGVFRVVVRRRRERAQRDSGEHTQGQEL